jgi:hypothetical protein
MKGGPAAVRGRGGAWRAADARSRQTARRTRCVLWQGQRSFDLVDRAGQRNFVRAAFTKAAGDVALLGRFPGNMFRYSATPAARRVCRAIFCRCRLSAARMRNYERKTIVKIGQASELDPSPRQGPGRLAPADRGARADHGEGRLRGAVRQVPAGWWVPIRACPMSAPRR